jgi:hypothetical protein
MMRESRSTRQPSCRRGGRVARSRLAAGLRPRFVRLTGYCAGPINRPDGRPDRRASARPGGRRG